MSQTITIFSNPPRVNIGVAKIYTVVIENRSQAVTVQVNRPAISIGVSNVLTAAPATDFLSLGIYGHLVVGHSDGSGLPDVITQAKIDNLMARGVSIEDIVWVDRGLAVSGLFAMPFFDLSAKFSLPVLAGICIGDLVLPVQINSPSFALPGLIGIVVYTGAFIVPGMATAPTWAVPILAGICIGSLTLPVQAFGPNFAPPGLIGIVTGSGLFTIPAMTVTPAWAVPALAGTCIGVLTLPPQAIGANFAPPGLTGVVISTGSFTMPGIGSSPVFAIPTLTGIEIGLHTLPTLSVLPTMAVPTLAASATPIVLATSGLISCDDWTSGSLGSWSTIAGSPAVVDVSGNNKLLVGTTTGGQLSRSFTATSAMHVMAQKQAIGTSTASEGAYNSVIIVAPNGTDNYRCMFDTRVSTTLPQIKKNNVNMVLGNPPIGASDNASHDLETIVSSTGIDIYIDGKLYAHYTDTAFTSFSQVILTGSSATGSAGHGAYFDNVTICKSKNITCSGSGILTGYKLRIGGVGGKVSAAAGSNGATLTVNCAGIRTRQTYVEVLNGSAAVVAMLMDVNNVYPGNAYTYG